MKSQLTADRKAFDRQGGNLGYLVYYKINCCLKTIAVDYVFPLRYWLKNFHIVHCNY